ncbi:hypothetical protein B4Q13_21595 [Lacticaseibacillus rhamnosus]
MSDNELYSAADKLFKAHSRWEDVGDADATGWAPQLWNALQQNGFSDVPVPEQLGGRDPAPAAQPGRDGPHGGGAKVVAALSADGRRCRRGAPRVGFVASCSRPDVQTSAHQSVELVDSEHTRSTTTMKMVYKGKSGDSTTKSSSHFVKADGGKLRPGDRPVIVEEKQ